METCSISLYSQAACGATYGVGRVSGLRVSILETCPYYSQAACGATYGVGRVSGFKGFNFGNLPILLS
jgi:hypothetical protein